MREPTRAETCSISEACALLGRSRRTIERLLQTGQLVYVSRHPHVRICSLSVARQVALRMSAPNRAGDPTYADLEPRLDKSKRTIQRLVAQRILQAYRSPDGLTRIRSESIDAYLAQQKPHH